MRIAQLANFVGPSSGGMKTAVTALGAGYVSAGVERLLVVLGACNADRGYFRMAAAHTICVQNACASVRLRRQYDL